MEPELGWLQEPHYGLLSKDSQHHPGPGQTDRGTAVGIIPELCVSEHEMCFNLGPWIFRLRKILSEPGAEEEGRGWVGIQSQQGLREEGGKGEGDEAVSRLRARLAREQLKE